MMRGQESRYLKPLLLKVDDLLEHGVPRGLLLPTSTPFHGVLATATTGEVYDEDTAAVHQWGQQA